MKLIMVGTPTCIKCKGMKPRIEKYCKSNDIEFQYELLQDLEKDILDYLVSKNVKSAPAFIIYKSEVEYPIVVTGDDIFLELESMNK